MDMNGDKLSKSEIYDSHSAARSNLIVVGIGASAGGVEALERLFSAMPCDTGMAFVVVQHLSPDFESLMPQILSRKTEMPVHTIESGMRMEANALYVLPSGQDVLVDSAVLETVPHSLSRKEYPIDSFFASLANEFGENAVGVVLSGTGSDGSRGIRHIHESQGLVVVQSVSSSKFNGMPRSAIATGLADAVVHVDDIPTTLLQYKELAENSNGEARQTQFAKSMDAERRIQHLLNRKFGIDFEQYKSGLFGRRLSRRISLGKYPGTEAYLKKLEETPKELSELYNDMLIGVTEFFRDAEAFNELQHRVLPDLIETAANDSNEFRVWVAPCATGEEAYSVAILIDELIQQRDYNIDVKIFATDVNDLCIDKAGRGVYTQDRMGNVSAERLRKYFHESENGFEICPRIRQQLIFATHDLLNDAPFTKLNLVTCRNLLIYFQPEAKKKALSLFNFSLKNSGVLFLGPSETTAELDSAYKPINEKWRIYRKADSIRFSQVKMPIGSVSTRPETKLSPLPTTDTRNKKLLSIYDSLLAQYMPPGILIDQHEKILHVFGDAVDILKYKAGRPTDKLFELLPETFRLATRNGLKRIRVEGKPVVYHGLELEQNETVDSYSLRIQAVEDEPPHYLIKIEKFANPTECIDAETGQIEFDTNARDTIRSLEEELQETRESLHDSIINLKSANEEMQTTNEELIASNEELQSTNEELHSVNEELYTVNSEYQRKITELTELTDDMDNLLDSLQVDTIYLDSSLRVRKFTIGIANTFNLLPIDIGREFESFSHDLKIDNLPQLIRDILKNKKVRDEEVEDHNGNWYLMRLLPYNSRGKIEGVLLTLIDITKIKHAEQQLAELSEIVEASDDAIFRVSNDGVIKTWNQGAINLFFHQPEDVIGKSVSVLNLDETSEVAILHSLDKLTEGQKLDHVHLKASRRNGEEFDVLSTISPIYESNGELVGASIVLRDVTMQKQAEFRIREEVRRRDHFLAVLSHELRNPTAAIMNAATLLSRKQLNPEKQAKASEIVCRHANQLSKMMEDLLDVARVTNNKVRLELKPTDLVATARQVIECIEHRLNQKKQLLTMEIPDKPIYRMLDETRIIQAQTNLMVNACKYASHGGHIRYSIWEEEQDVVIEVSDDGQGMSDKLLKKIFQVFVQADQHLDRKVGGMGLGLPIVKMIANAHGGSIVARSDGVGKGSTFTMRLPLLEPQSTPVIEKNVRLDLHSGDDRKLLLVEDNAGAREMLSAYLEEEGFDVSTAENGLDGLRKIQDTSPEICILDIGLPDLDGFQVAKHVCKTDSRPELLIALTGYGQGSDRQKVIDAGFDLHLVKPIDPELLLEEIYSLLGKANESANPPTPTNS